MNSVTTNPEGNNERPARDASGYTVFSAGDVGAAHVLAHRMFDEGRIAEGHRLLGEWLEGRSGTGSDWVHIQFHMAVFELELGLWNAAFNRFQEQILPTAASSEDALTDAPALLWRLALTAPANVELPWEAVRQTAIKRLERPADPFVELHNLLALAGAGDVDGLDRWLEAQPPCEDNGRECLVRTMVVGLRAYVTRTYRQAASVFERLLPRMAEVGGSLAQNQLFQDIAETTWSLVNEDAFRPVQQEAA